MTRSRAEARQASGELFPSDSPIPAGQLIGRRDDVRELATRLEAGTHLIVAGPRRTGKTSVCEAALGRLARRGAYTAKVDLFRVSDAAELAEAVAAAVIANRSAAHRALRRARSAGRAALSAAQAQAVLKMVGELGEGVEIAVTPGLAARDPERALDLALELPERVAQADGRRMVLFFDEFQEVASARRPYGDPDAVTNRMRAIFQRSSVGLLPVRRQHRARDARPLRAEPACLQRLRELLRPARDRGRRMASRPRRALCLRPLHGGGRRAGEDRGARWRPPAGDDAYRPTDASGVDRARDPRDRPRAGAAGVRAGARGGPPDDGADGRAHPATSQARAAGGANRGCRATRCRGGSSRAFATASSSCSGTLGYWNTSRAVAGG